MNDNYYRILEFFQNSPDNINSNNAELNQLVEETNIFNRQEIVWYCQKKLGKINNKLFIRSIIYFILGIFLGSFVYIALYFLFPSILGNSLSSFLVILNCIFLVFGIREKYDPLVKKKSKYTIFYSSFSSN